jgi:hypothetical protein
MPVKKQGEPVELQKINRLKFKAPGRLPVGVEESIEYTSHYQREKKPGRSQPGTAREEPAVSYRWTTGRDWEITGWSSRLQENHRSMIGENRQWVTDEPVEFEK